MTFDKCCSYTSLIFLDGNFLNHRTGLTLEGNRGRHGYCIERHGEEVKGLVFTALDMPHISQNQKSIFSHITEKKLRANDATLLCLLYIHVFPPRGPDGAILPPCCTSVLIGWRLSQITQWPLTSAVHAPCTVALNHALILKLISGYQEGQLISCKFTLVIQLI